MAIPTNFQGYTPAANTTKSFRILGTATTGVWGNDVDGTLTPVSIPIAPGAVVLMTTVYTDAQLVELFRDFIRRHGDGEHVGGSGGLPRQTTKQITLTSTTCT